MYDLYFAGDDYKNLDDFILQYWDLNYIKFPILYAFNAMIIIPLSLIKDLSKMKFVSLIGVFVVILVILVVVIQSPFFIIHNIQEGILSSDKINWFNAGTGFYVDSLWFFRGTAVFFFAFTCHTGVFPVYASLKNNHIRRINKVFQRSIFLVYVLYMFAGICGFLSVPIDCPDLIVYRNTIFGNDIFMTIAKIGMMFTLSMAIPVNYSVFRMSFFEVVWKTKEVDNCRNLYITIPMLLLCTLVGLLYQRILGYLSILGVFCSVIICFFFPGKLYY